MFDPGAIGTTIIGLRADRDALDVERHLERTVARAPRRGIRQQSAVVLARLLPHWVGSRGRAASRQPDRWAGTS